MKRREHTEQPVTPEQAQLARGLIAEWFAAQADAAEQALIKAAAAVNKVKDEQRAWQAGTPLTPIQALLCEAAQQQLYQDAARRFLDGTGARDEADGLRASCEVLKRYLSKTYGTGEEAQP